MQSMSKDHPIGEVGVHRNDAVTFLVYVVRELEVELPLC